MILSAQNSLKLSRCEALRNNGRARVKSWSFDRMAIPPPATVFSRSDSKRNNEQDTGMENQAWYALAEHPMGNSTFQLRYGQGAKTMESMDMDTEAWAGGVKHILSASTDF